MTTIWLQSALTIALAYFARAFMVSPDRNGLMTTLTIVNFISSLRRLIVDFVGCMTCI